MQTVGETERLALKVFSPEDAIAAQQFWGDEAVMEQAGGAAPHAILLQVLASYRECHIEKGLSVYGVLEKGTGELIGAAGFNLHGLNGQAELIYHFSKRNWGKGFATEAARVCIELARKRPEIGLLYASAAPANEGSLKVLEKVGFNYIELKWFEDTQQHEPYYELPL